MEERRPLVRSAQVKLTLCSLYNSKLILSQKQEKRELSRSCHSTAAGITDLLYIDSVSGTSSHDKHTKGLD